MSSQERPERSKLPPKKDFSPPKFFQQVKKYKMLWDPSDTNCKNSAMREAVWKKIAGRFWNMTGLQCELMWDAYKKNRGQFNRRKAKREASGAAASKRSKEFYEWEKEMSFIPSVRSPDGDGEANLPHPALDVSVSSIGSMMDSDMNLSLMASPVLSPGKQVRVTISSSSKPVVLSKKLQFSKMNSDFTGTDESSTERSPEKKKKYVRKGKTVTILSPVVEEKEEPSPKADVKIRSKKEIESLPLEEESEVDDMFQGKGRKGSTKLQKYEERQRRREALKNQIQLKVQEIKKGSQKSSQAAPCSSSIIEACEAPAGLLKEACRAMLKNLSEKPQQEDEHDLLCLSLAAKMRKLPSKQQRRVAQSFLATICKAEDEAEASESEIKPAKTTASTGASDKPILVEDHDQEPAGKNVDNADPIVVERLSLKKSDMAVLDGTAWLTDAIINAYMKLLEERMSTRTVTAVSTHFIPFYESHGYCHVKRWLPYDDVFEKDLVLAMLIHRRHWTLAVIEPSKRLITHYDSYMEYRHEAEMTMHPHVPVLHRYLLRLESEMLGVPVDQPDPWQMEEAVDVPQQGNSNDCGVFGLMFAEYLARSAPITFGQEDMPHFRNKIRTELTEGCVP